MGLADNVRWRRTAMGMSQADLARRVRLHGHHPDRSYICRLEQGKVDPPVSMIRSLARAFSIKPWQLLADLQENTEFWRGYLDLSGKAKRDVQRHIDWLLRKG